MLEQGVMAQPDDLRAANDYRMAVVKNDKIERFEQKSKAARAWA